ncbi:UNVERIFIED_CONTAM: hypothetical protein FKN15_029609 [Acipenser sinensis]
MAPCSQRQFGTVQAFQLTTKCILRSGRTGGCSQRASTYPRACPSSHSTSQHSARTTNPGREEHIFVHGGLWLLECVLFTFVLAGRY